MIPNKKRMQSMHVHQNGIDLSAIGQQRQQMAAQVSQMVFATAQQIYAQTASVYLCSNMNAPAPERAASLRALAESAKDAAPYLVEAFGVIKVEDPPPPPAIATP